MAARAQDYCMEINIKSDMPTAAEALRRLNSHIQTARARGGGAIKVIHGYGSTGRGGKIRQEVRRTLSDMKARRQIRDFIPGEEFSIFSEATRMAFDRCSALRRDSDLDRSNNGVTIIIL